MKLQSSLNSFYKIFITPNPIRPFIEPLWIRLSAVYGGLFVLRRTANKVLLETNDDKQRVKAIVCSEGQLLKTQHVVCNLDHAANFIAQHGKKYTNKAYTGSGTYAEYSSRFVLGPAAQPFASRTNRWQVTLWHLVSSLPTHSTTVTRYIWRRATSLHSRHRPASVSNIYILIGSGPNSQIWAELIYSSRTRVIYIQTNEVVRSILTITCRCGAFVRWGHWTGARGLRASGAQPVQVIWRPQR